MTRSWVQLAGATTLQSFRCNNYHSCCPDLFWFLDYLSVTDLTLAVMTQLVERVEDAAIAADLGLDCGSLYLCVHSGSRGLGESVYRAHAPRIGGQGLALVRN